LLVYGERSKRKFEKKFNPDGFNVGINFNEAAGQTVPHVHKHLSNSTKVM